METIHYEILELSIGGYHSSHCWGRFDFRTGLVKTMKSEHNEPYKEGESATITQAFNADDLSNHVRHFYPERWLPEYVNPGVLDGIQWELKILYNGGKEARTYGSNDWPQLDGSPGGQPGDLFNFLLVHLNHSLNRWHFDF